MPGDECETEDDRHDRSSRHMQCITVSHSLQAEMWAATYALKHSLSLCVFVYGDIVQTSIKGANNT